MSARRRHGTDGRFASVDRLTKLAVVLWVGGALVAQARLLDSWPALLPLTLGVAVVAAVSAWFDRRTVALILALAYLAPALIGTLHGLVFAPFIVVWMAALYGAMLPDALSRPWQLPTPWRGPLVYAAFACIAGAMVVIWREADGVVALVTDLEAMHWRGGDPPQFAASWTLHVALVLLVGILWFDWLCGADVDVERSVVTPLLITAFVMTVTAAWQLFVNMRFANPTSFAVPGRTTGTMYDANVLGLLSALWIGGAVVWADRLGGWRVYAAPVMVLAGWIAVWGSGSKSALAAASILTLTVPLTMGWRVLRGRGVVLAGPLAAGIVAAVLLFGAMSTRPGNPAARAWRDFVASGSPAHVAVELWNRNGFGAAASSLVQRFPVAGIGVGRFYSFVTAFPRTDGRGRLPPDNAQNWWRHQLAEFGVVGAAGFLVFSAAFAWFVLRPRPQRTRGAAVVRVMLAVFAYVSLFGMPGQDAMVAITFWSLAFWYVRLSGASLSAAPVRAWQWALGAVLLGVFAVVSYQTAVGELRLATRARVAGSPFSYGFGEPGVDGATDGFRVTTTRAAAVVSAEGPWLEVTVRLDAAHAGTPVDVVIRADGATVLKATLGSTAPVTAFVPIDPTERRVLLDAFAEALGTRLSPFAAQDLGVQIKWTAADHLPPGAAGYRRTAG